MLQKFLITAAIILAVWYGFKWVGRMKVIREKEAKDKLRRGAGGSGGGAGSADSSSATGDAEEMVECAVCGAFVAVQGAKDCGKDNCPYQG